MAKVNLKKVEEIYKALCDEKGFVDTTKVMNKFAKEGIPQRILDGIMSHYASGASAEDCWAILQQHYSDVLEEGRVLKFKVETTSDAESIKAQVEKNPLNAKAEIKGLEISIDTTDNDPKEIEALVHRFPFKVIQVEEEDLDEKWAAAAEVPAKEKGKYEGEGVTELRSQLSKLKQSGPHKKGSAEYGKMKELAFAIRAKTGWGKVDESNIEEAKKVRFGEKIGTIVDKMTDDSGIKMIKIKFEDGTESWEVADDVKIKTVQENKTTMKTTLTKEEKVAKVTEAIEKLSGKKVVLEDAIKEVKISLSSKAIKDLKEKHGVNAPLEIAKVILKEAEEEEEKEEEKDSEAKADDKETASEEKAEKETSKKEVDASAPILGNIIPSSSIKEIEAYVEKTLGEIEASVKELRALKKSIGSSAEATGENWKQKTERLKFNIAQVGRIGQYCNNTILANKFDKALLAKIINLQSK